MSRELELQGECIAVRLHRRDTKDPHILVEILVEDDGAWHSKMVFSSHWLREFRQMLTMAEDFVVTQKPDIQERDGRQYGWRFDE